jgi:hypothetical protein
VAAQADERELARDGDEVYHETNHLVSRMFACPHSASLAEKAAHAFEDAWHALASQLVEFSSPPAEQDEVGIEPLGKIISEKLEYRWG